MTSTRPRLAVFLGPAATVANTAPLITSESSRSEAEQFPDGRRVFDALRPQRLAAPVDVYVEQFSAHPLERDAAELYGPPDGYLAADGTFTAADRGGPDAGTPVYRIRLRPQDGLYPLPYVARQAGGEPWNFDGAARFAPAERTRQPFFPDPSRLVEEIDRFGLDGDGRVGQLHALADFDFFRAAPGGGYTKGDGDRAIAPEVRGRDFFPYRPPHLSRHPDDAALIRLTTVVAETLADGRYDGAIWLEASPSVEETLYWLSLLVGTDRPIVGVVAPDWAHGITGNSGDRNIIDAVRYCCSRQWADASGADEIGPVLVEGGRIFPAREVRKLDSHSGRYGTTGGMGGAIGTTGHGASPVVVGFRGRRRHTASSRVTLGQVPQSVDGVRHAAGGSTPVAVTLRDRARLREDVLPYVEIVKHADYQQDRPGTIRSVLERAGDNGLVGVVAEGLTPYGAIGVSGEQEIVEAIYRGVPVVKVARDAADGFVDRYTVRLGIAGGNLSATKARMLLMACLLHFGALPPAVDPSAPTPAESAAVAEQLARYQAIFDTH